MERHRRSRRGDRRGADAEVGRGEHVGVGHRVEAGQGSHASRSPAAMPRPRTQSRHREPGAARGLHLAHGERAVAGAHHEPVARREHPRRARRAWSVGDGAEQLDRRVAERGPRARARDRRRAPAARARRPRGASRGGRCRGRSWARGSRRPRPGARAARSRRRAGRARPPARSRRARQAGGERAGGLARRRSAWRSGAAPARCRVPASICMMLTPVSRSPARMACWIGAAPRQRGSSEAWTLIMPCGGEREHGGPEDVAVGDDDAEVGLEPAEAGEEDVAQRAVRLEHRDPGALRLPLDRRRHQRRARAALRLVRLGHDAHHLVPLARAAPGATAPRTPVSRRRRSASLRAGRFRLHLFGVSGVVLVLAPVAGEQHLPLDQAEVVEEEDAVEVVDLVLDGAGLEPGRLLRGSGCRRGRWPRCTTRSGRLTSP